jgi:hypothetical protein
MFYTLQTNQYVSPIIHETSISSHLSSQTISKCTLAESTLTRAGDITSLPSTYTAHRFRFQNAYSSPGSTPAIARSYLFFPISFVRYFTDIYIDIKRKFPKLGSLCCKRMRGVIENHTLTVEFLTTIGLLNPPLPGGRGGRAQSGGGAGGGPLTSIGILLRFCKLVLDSFAWAFRRWISTCTGETAPWSSASLEAAEGEG